MNTLLQTYFLKKTIMRLGLVIIVFLYFTSLTPVYAGCNVINIGGSAVQVCGWDDNQQDEWTATARTASSFDQLADWMYSAASGHGDRSRTATSVSCANGASVTNLGSGGGGGGGGSSSPLPAVNGGWSSWSTSCVDGMQTRTCSSPAPANGGSDCGGPSSQFCPPTASLSAVPGLINSGKTSRLYWTSTNATSCESMGGFSTSGTTSGYASTSVLTSTQYYQTSCTGAGGTINSNIATVTVLHPTITTFTISPERVLLGGSVDINWGATDVDSCIITKNGSTLGSPFASSGGLINSGSISDTNITSQALYGISCSNAAGGEGGTVAAATQTHIVNVVSSFTEF